MFAGCPICRLAGVISCMFSANRIDRYGAGPFTQFGHTDARKCINWFRIMEPVEYDGQVSRWSYTRNADGIAIVCRFCSKGEGRDFRRNLEEDETNTEGKKICNRSNHNN